MAIRHGFLNYVPQVHNSQQRTAAANYYGSSTTLGKSSLETYTENFKKF